MADNDTEWIGFFDDYEDKFLCIKTPLRLASGEEITLFKQASQCVSRCNSLDQDTYEDFENDGFYVFPEQCSAAYENVFPDYFHDNKTGQEIRYLLTPYVANKYGPWWTNVPSSRPKFTLGSDEPTANRDFIELEFHEEVFPIRLSVVKVRNPGSIIKVWARDIDNKWHLMWSSPPQILPMQQRVFSPPLKNCNYKTKFIRLELDHSAVDYFSIVSAVFLIGSSNFIVHEDESMNSSSFVESLKDSESDIKDSLNLTPNLIAEALGEDLLKLEKILQSCVLYKSETTSIFPEIKTDLSPSTDTTTDVHKVVNGSRNKFDFLSDEVLTEILKLLDIRSLCRCSQVNQRFSMVARDYLLFKSVTLKSYWHCIDDGVLNFLTSRCQYLRRLDLSWCGNDEMITSKAFNAFLKACGRLLTDLRLDYCEFVDESVIEEISLTCSNLRELCLCGQMLTQTAYQPLTRFELLERFEINNSSIEEATLCEIIKKNPKMRHLDVGRIRYFYLDIDNVAEVTGDSCPDLESFKCAVTFITARGVQALHRCSRLREVDFGFCCLICDGKNLLDEEQSVRNLFVRCPFLERIVLTSTVSYFEDKVFEPLMSRPIKQLHLGGSKYISEETCLRLMVTCPNLEMIDLTDCSKIDYDNIVNWRIRYPKITIKCSDFRWEFVPPSFG